MYAEKNFCPQQQPEQRKVTGQAPSAASVIRQLNHGAAQLKAQGGVIPEQAVQTAHMDENSFAAGSAAPAPQLVPNATGLPDDLKSGVENLSGYSLDDVRVNFNSEEPAQLRARAFTRGAEIHLAPGQEKHLPHEAWHVVQQKQGRVAATGELPGGTAINDEPALEREADEMGALAAGGAADNAAGAVPLFAAAASGPVQRKVGVELETGWLVAQGQVERKLSLGDPLRLAYMEGAYTAYVNHQPLKKNDTVKNCAGFSITADEAGGGESEIEFVTKPFDERNDLENALDGIVSYAEQYISVASRGNFKPFRFERFLITPYPGDAPDKMRAGPQVTFGLPLNKIPHYIELKRKTPVVETETPHLDGLVQLMITYIEGGLENVPIEYPKRITDSFLLSRTNFGRLFQLAVEKDNLTGLTLEQWKARFTDAGFDITQKLFACGILDEGALCTWEPDTFAALMARGKENAPNLTIAQWLEGIYGEGHVDALASIKDHESMSQSDKLEATAAGPGGIFEYRGEQGSKKPHTRWKEYAMTAYDDIARILDSDPKDLRKPKSGT